MILLKFVVYLSIIATGSLIGIVNYKNNIRMRPVVFLLILTFISELMSFIFASTIRNNNVVYHFFNPIQAIVWGYFFYNNVSGSIRSTIPVTLVFLVVFAAINTSCLQGFNVFPGYFVLVENVVLLFWSASLFLNFLDRPAIENIFYNPIFITCIAVIWFSLISYIFFGLFNFFVVSKKSTHAIRSILQFANYIYYTLLLIGMLLKEKSAKHEN
jgi:hypothetical protein